MQSSSNSLDINSQGSNKDYVDNQICNLNNQYFTVRRPNENNVLEFMDIEVHTLPVKQLQHPITIQVRNGDSSDIDNQLLDDYQDSAHISQKILNNNISNNNNISINNHKEQRIVPLMNKLVDLFPIFSCSKRRKGRMEMMRDLSSHNSEFCTTFNNQFNQHIKLCFELMFIITNLLYIIEISLRWTFTWIKNFHLIFYILNILTNILNLILISKQEHNSNRRYQKYIKILTISLILLFLILDEILKNRFLSIPNILLIYFIYTKLQDILNKYQSFYYYQIIAFKYLFNYIVLLHVSACFFCIFSSLDEHSWVQEHQQENYQFIYTSAFLWSTTTTTFTGQYVIQLNTQIERILAIILILSTITILIYTYLKHDIGKDQQYIQYTKNLIVSRYFEKRNIKKYLKDLALTELQNQWEISDQNIDEENHILSYLPYSIQKSIYLSMFQNTLTLIPFCRKLSDKCIKELTLGLHELVLPSQKIIQDNGLYFLLEGEIQLRLPDNSYLRLLSHQGDILGQQITFLNKEQPYIAITSKPTRLAYLEKHKFREILSHHRQDYQLYMMELEQNKIDVGLKCYICDEIDHQTDNCPETHLILNKFEIIARHMHSEDMHRVKIDRNRRRTTNAKFGQRLFEDAASMYQEILISLQEISQAPPQNNLNLNQFSLSQSQGKSLRKKSRSLGSEDSKFYKSSSNHSISAIPKQNQGSALSSSSFNIFKDVQQRKISKQQDSDKVSSNSINKNHKQSSSNSQKETPQNFIMEDAIVDDSLHLTQQRMKRALIGKMTSLRVQPPPNHLPQSGSESPDEEQSLLQQYSINSSRKHNQSQKVRGSSKYNNDTYKELLQRQYNLEAVFDSPANLEIYFPNDNLEHIVEEYIRFQNR